MDVRTHSNSFVVRSPLWLTSNHVMSCLMICEKNALRSRYTCLSHAISQHQVCAHVKHGVLKSTDHPANVCYLYESGQQHEDTDVQIVQRKCRHARVELSGGERHRSVGLPDRPVRRKKPRYNIVRVAFEISTIYPLMAVEFASPRDNVVAAAGSHCKTRYDTRWFFFLNLRHVLCDITAVVCLMNVFVMSPKYMARTGKLAPVANDMTVPTIISIASQMSAYRNCTRATTFNVETNKIVLTVNETPEMHTRLYHTRHLCTVLHARVQTQWRT